MQVYLAIKYQPDNSNQQAIEAISAILTRAGARTWCVARDIERWGEVHYAPSTLMQSAFRLLDTSDLLLLELSQKGVGLGIEAGYAYARGIPILTIAREGSHIFETVRGIASGLAYYRDWDEIEAIFRSFVEQNRL